MTDYNAIQRKRNIIVGAFVIIATAAMLWMVAIFGELPVAATKLRSYYVTVKFPSVMGIQSKTPVYYHGYQIGKVIMVQSPKLLPGPDGEPIHQSLVTLAIEDNYQTIPKNVDFKVIKRSMGSSFILLEEPKEFPDPDLPPKDRFLHGESEIRYQGSVGSTNEFISEETQEKLETLVVKLSSLASSFENIIGDSENQENLKVALANFASLTKEAEAALISVTNFTDTGTVALTETSESLNKTLKEANKIMNSINEGNGTVSRLINDGRLYENLLESTKELKLALEQFKIFASEAQEKGLKIKL